jgi:hypothetical protein
VHKRIRTERFYPARRRYRVCMNAHGPVTSWNNKHLNLCIEKVKGRRVYGIWKIMGNILTDTSNRIWLIQFYFFKTKLISCSLRFCPNLLNSICPTALEWGRVNWSEERITSHRCQNGRYRTLLSAFLPDMSLKRLFILIQDPIPEHNTRK